QENRTKVVTIESSTYWFLRIDLALDEAKLPQIRIPPFTRDWKHSTGRVPTIEADELSRLALFDDLVLNSQKSLNIWHRLLFFLFRKLDSGFPFFIRKCDGGRTPLAPLKRSPVELWAMFIRSLCARSRW